ncbi:MAG: hypothetical protein QOH73_1211, partial [Gaiellaceae bacterium]|nr:hypothetical protein [Gaiellaceae bacterium]
MSRRPPLEAPVWLIERAATDDPPTVLATELLEQFARVGVVELMPTAGTSILDVADAERATGVGVGGPGFAFAEEFLEESARVAAALERLWAYVEQFDRLRTLRLAATDMQLVAT